MEPGRNGGHPTIRELNWIVRCFPDVNRFVQVLLGAGFAAITWLAFTSTSSFDPAEAGAGVGPRGVYDPVTAGEPLPDGFRQLLPRDGIQPIYDPVFTDVAGVDWPAETQVIGIAEGTEAKAYPVSFLNRHEMVDDFIAGEPILVTW